MNVEQARDRLVKRNVLVEREAERGCSREEHTLSPDGGRLREGACRRGRKQRGAEATTDSHGDRLQEQSHRRLK